MARFLLPPALAALLLALPGAASAASLAGTKWTVVSVRGHAVPPSAGERLSFRAHRFSGDDGCNRFSGRYRATGIALRFTDVVTTAIGCEGGPPRISDPIDRVRGYRRSGDRLQLLGRRGRTLAVLRRR